MLGMATMAGRAWAQDGEEPLPACDLRLEGHVTDEVFELAVPGVRVVVTEASTGRERATRSGADGTFRIDGLCAGEHALVALDDFHDPLSRTVVLPTDHVHLELHGEVGEEVIVETEPWGTKDTRSSTTLSGEVLDRTRGDDLAQVASQAPGVVVARGTGDVSKPIIRGLSERRLLVLFDGVRQEGQKWGADHGTEIDPFAAGSFTVVRGAAGVRYGPDALGGVVEVDPLPLREEPGVGGEGHLVGSVNGWRTTAAMRVDGAPAKVPGLAFRLEGNVSRGAAQRAPTYVLGNTASEQWNAGATLGWRSGGVEVTGSWRHHHLKAGVFYGSRLETADGLTLALAGGDPQGAGRWRTSFAIDRPYQAVDHDLGLLRVKASLGPGTLQATYSVQLDHRRELDTVRNADESMTPQADFRLRTHELDLSFAHRPVHAGSVNLGGTVGAQGQFQQNVYDGLPLLPNVLQGTFGVFAHERLWGRAGELEIGGRYDHQTQIATLTERDYLRNKARGALGPESCDELDWGGARCLRAWNTGAVSVGGLVRAVHDLMDLKLDLSSASRFPDLDELYLNGTAPSLPVYGVGDPSLGVETSWSASLTGALDHPWIHGEVSGFFSYVQRYIEFAPVRGPGGAPDLVVLSRGTFPRYAYQAVDALFYGVDGQVSVAPEAVVGVDVGGAMVRAQEVADPDGRVAGVPPDRLRGALVARIPVRGAVQRTRLQVDGTYVARQGRWDDTTDLAPPPPAYGLLGASVGLTVQAGRHEVDLDLQGRNLTNGAYRLYTALNRYFADEPGWDLRLRATVRFDVHPGRPSPEETIP